MTALLLDRDQPLTRYCSRFWTIFSCRNGIFSPLERLAASHALSEIVYYHPDEQYELKAAAVLGVKAARSTCDASTVEACVRGDVASLQDTFSTVLDSAAHTPNETLASLGEQIEQDLQTLLASGSVEPAPDLPEGVFVVGDHSQLFCHKEARILPGTLINTEDGPVIIDAGATVGQFSYLAGPAYIGPDTQVDNCRVLGPSVIGRNCRVGGEIESTIFGDFSNKHHEGFLGHSFVGRWVNIGALATTSDLKNNYGTVNLTTPAPFIEKADELTRVTTGTNKFGSIISDCAKIAIGVMINTGSVIDCGSNVFERPIPKYIPPFSWGPGNDRYTLERFLQDCETIFARRKQVPSPAFEDLATYLWSSSK